jgi:D-alanyl-lipoteichoic acid acyltransferase DltB (MBOAT superfamily)
MIYFLLKEVKHRKILLLLAGWFFYAAWKPEYIFLLLLSTLVDFVAAKQIYKTGNIRKKNMFLILSIIVNLGILFGFKYFNFFDRNLFRFLSVFNLEYSKTFNDFILPVGISFYTFQTMSYTIDVYRKKNIPENKFWNFALFVSFFPQLVAGPIERFSKLMPQFEKKHVFEYKRVTSGLKLIFWGFFQKIVIADSMQRFVEIVYSNPSNYQGLDILLVTLFFGVQIYGDFSGYNDIARGSARILGYELSINFNLPYFSKSFAEFWRRWHITLSSWFRDYVYIPLGGNRSKTKIRIYFNLMITFVLSGFWHGASWTFIIWGMLHGIYYISERLFNSRFGVLVFYKYKLFKVFKIIFVFALVNFAWIFFRSKSITIAYTLIQNLFDFSLIKLSFDRTSVAINIILSSLLFIVHFIERKKDIITFVSEQNLIVRYSIYYTLILIMIGFGNFGLQEFIYFQF